MNYSHSSAYQLIREYYGEITAKRSGVPYINHINEGLVILDKLNASNIVKDAFCIHPLFQGDTDLVNNKGMRGLQLLDPESIILAMEYRRVANSYLSHDDVSDFVGFTCEEVRLMLIADKVQNHKDFMIAHYGSHPRSIELLQYFNNWFEILDIRPTDFE